MRTGTSAVRRRKPSYVSGSLGQLWDVGPHTTRAQALVIDIRFNQGGSDSRGYAIVSSLIEEPVLVALKRAV